MSGGLEPGGYVGSLADRADTVAAQLSPAQQFACLSIGPENVRSFSLTMENTLPFRDRPAISTGTIDVQGQMVVTFQDDGTLFRMMRKGQRALANQMLRMVRPHIGRRKFRRVRAQVRKAMREKGL